MLLKTTDLGRSRSGRQSAVPVARTREKRKMQKEWENPACCKTERTGNCDDHDDALSGLKST